MDFYSSVDQYYDLIFPTNRAQVSLIQSYVADTTDCVLDVGCATGSLALKLSSIGYCVHAFDLNKHMLEQARTKMEHSQTKVHFREGNMLNIGEMYQAEQFGGVVCLGNTLVHLNNENEVRHFLNQAHSVLKPDGVLLLQLLNYEYILDEQISTLPLIENEEISFVRSYKHQSSSEIRFHTILKMKKEGREVENEISLYPITRKILNHLLAEVGFSNLEWFGSFQLETLQAKSLPLIVVAHK